MRLNKLDNPVWHALHEHHTGLSLNYDNLLCYKPNVCPFGGYILDKPIAEHLNAYAKLGTDFFIVGEKPDYTKALKLNFELVCVQMVAHNTITQSITEEIIHLNGQFEEELYQLVCMVMPGYYKHDTPLMGNYYGIFKDGKLVATAGERLSMDGFTEVSAIVTHPEHIGQGYAKQLTAYMANAIFSKGQIPFLHTGHTNNKAISLYQKLGFSIRREISFWNFSA